MDLCMSCSLLIRTIACSLLPKGREINEGVILWHMQFFILMNTIIGLVTQQ